VSDKHTVVSLLEGRKDRTENNSAGINAINMDGQCQGYNHTLFNTVCNEVMIPVIASSGAGKAAHF